MRSQQTKQAGFTLIELMVVVVIAATMAAFIGVRINRDNDRTARLEAKRFVTVLNEVRDEALMTGRVHVLQFNRSDRSYLFSTHSAQGGTKQSNRLLRERVLPEGIGIEFEVEKIENDQPEEGDEATDDDSEETSAKSNASGSVLISPVDELTPFTLTLSGDQHRYQISVNDEQRLETRRL